MKWLKVVKMATLRFTDAAARGPMGVAHIAAHQASRSREHVARNMRGDYAEPIEEAADIADAAAEEETDEKDG